MSSPRLFFVDTEATGASPFSSVMTEFGVVCFETRATFHGHLWDFHPHPDNPALPVADEENPGWTATMPKGYRDPLHPLGPFTGTRMGVRHEGAVYGALSDWLITLAEHAGRPFRPVFVSDNPGFDWQWLSFGFDRSGLNNPFGFSSRRIGDLAAGLAGDWRKTSAWKRARKTKHDHNPVNDALGNAEAFEALLRKHDQPF